MAAYDLEGVAADMARIMEELEAGVSRVLAGPEGWQGSAADAFAGHMKARGKVFELVEQALGTAAVALREYAGRLSTVQEGTRGLWPTRCSPVSG
jgi:uncharacterized protein YukE